MISFLTGNCPLRIKRKRFELKKEEKKKKGSFKGQLSGQRIEGTRAPLGMKELFRIAARNPCGLIESNWKEQISKG